MARAKNWTMLAYADVTRAADASEKGASHTADAEAKSFALPQQHLKSEKVNLFTAHSATWAAAHGHAPDMPRAGMPHHAPLLPSFMSIVHVMHGLPSKFATAKCLALAMSCALARKAIMHANMRA